MRSAMWLVTGAVLLLTVSSSANGSTGVDTGAVAIRINANEPEDCPVWLGNLKELCPVSWDTKETSSPGDDRIDVVKRVDEIQIKIRPPTGAPHITVGFEPRELRIYHPAYRFLNHTWAEADDHQPVASKEHLAFESRASRYYYNGTWHDSENQWGLYAVLYLPAPVKNWISFAAVCWGWDTCYVDNYDFLQVEEESVQPFPENVRAQDPNDTDAAMHRRVHEATFCQRFSPAEACGAQASTRPTLESMVSTYEELSPTVRWGVQYNRTTVQLKHGPHHGHGTAPDDRRSDSRSTDSQGSSPLHLPSKVSHAIAQPTLQSSEAEFPIATQASPVTSGSHAPVVTDPDSQTPYVWATVAGLFALLVWLLYHRITRSEALEYPARQRAYELVVQEPGIRVGTLASRLGLDFNTMKHHVRTLERLGLVTSAGSSQKRYFATGTMHLADTRTQLVGASPSATSIYRFLRMKGEADVSAVAQSLNLDASTVSHGAAWLERLGLVERRRHGKRVLVATVRDPHFGGHLSESIAGES